MLSTEQLIQFLAIVFLGIPAWIGCLVFALVGLVTRRAGWIVGSALLAIGPLLYFSATPRFRYIAPVGILLALGALLVVRRKGDIRVAAAMAASPLLFILVVLGVLYEVVTR